MRHFALGKDNFKYAKLSIKTQNNTSCLQNNI